MLVIGLTGGIATGKSEVSRILRELGATVIDADRVGHEAYAPGSQVWQEVVEAFGEDILTPTGEIDRKRLGSIVFRDPAARTTLNSIMHPRMADVIRGELLRLAQQGAEVAVVEAAVLLEAGWESLVDEIWVTHSPEELVAERLRRRDNLSEEEIAGRVNSQMSFEERARRADVLVRNTAGVEELREEVGILWSSRVKGKGRAVRHG